MDLGFEMLITVNRFLVELKNNIFLREKYYRVNTAEKSFGEQSVSDDHGDDADLGSDSDVEDSDSSSLSSLSTEGAVPA
jgi:hypothetical protein